MLTSEEIEKLINNAPKCEVRPSIIDGYGLFANELILSRWALKNTTRLRNVNRLKAYIQSVSGALHKFT